MVHTSPGSLDPVRTSPAIENNSNYWYELQVPVRLPCAVAHSPQAEHYRPTAGAKSAEREPSSRL